MKNEVLTFVFKVLKLEEDEQIVLEFVENLLEIQPQAVADKIVHNDLFTDHFVSKIESLDDYDL